MGEYATVNGTQIKLGTCDGFYYVRREELARWMAEGVYRGEDYLGAEGIFYRFPWPWEDGQDVAAIKGRDHRPSGLLLRAPKGVEVPHGMKTVHVSAGGGGYGLNVAFPCPMLLGPGEIARAKARLEENPRPDGWREAVCSSFSFGTMLRPTARRWWKRGTYTVFECVHCEEPFSLPVETVEAIQQACREEVDRYGTGGSLNASLEAAKRAAELELEVALRCEGKSW